jgi:hypothetical protein
LNQSLQQEAFAMAIVPPVFVFNFQQIKNKRTFFRRFCSKTFSPDSILPRIWPLCFSLAHFCHRPLRGDEHMCVCAVCFYMHFTPCDQSTHTTALSLLHTRFFLSRVSSLAFSSPRLRNQ